MSTADLGMPILFAILVFWLVFAFFAIATSAWDRFHPRDDNHRRRS